MPTLTAEPTNPETKKITLHELRKFLSMEQIQNIIADIDAKEAYKLRYDYDFWARPTQRLPDGDWRIWMMHGGRGSGKTWTGANVMKKWSKDNPRLMFIGRTAYDVRDTMVEGDSGILAISPKHWRPEYFPSKRKLVWPNGSVALLRSADEPDSIRGPQFYKAWGDELAAWRYGKETLDNILFALRLGNNPQMLVTSTPRPTKLVKGIVAMPGTRITQDSTYSNIENLAQQWADQIIGMYQGTRTGLQELEGRILDDNPYALWSRAMLDNTRVRVAPDITEIVVAVDPMVAELTAKEIREEGRLEFDDEERETGIVVVGRTGVAGDVRAHGYTLDDMSLTGTPFEWSCEVVAAFHKYNADKVVAEANNGGALIKAVIHTIDPNIPVELVYASRGKLTRAEPVSNLFAQGRAHNMGTFIDLEDQLCEWQPGMPSPDRLDAAVWGYTYLMVNPELQALEDLSN